MPDNFVHPNCFTILIALKNSCSGDFNFFISLLFKFELLP